ncbi:hypothetical protein SAMN05444156_2162 [Verrucomicrobium sp. GAS474]|uniref:hypothetical protein n=1 Tax=Verrucomicrobium sp. GAS474 TaxID=1882831 RepID=UPI00087D8405|nr:hypothetical protein [Verrucomicrobium sp. GAS474]SDU13428.1 hypothetical protein SAMN05444156_2162 [Verrucomicrobium sp. GAS474]
MTEESNQNEASTDNSTIEHVLVVTDAPKGGVGKSEFTNHLTSTFRAIGLDTYIGYDTDGKARVSKDRDDRFRLIDVTALNDKDAVTELSQMLGALGTAPVVVVDPMAHHEALLRDLFERQHVFDLRLPKVNGAATILVFPGSDADTVSQAADAVNYYRRNHCGRDHRDVRIVAVLNGHLSKGFEFWQGIEESELVDATVVLPQLSQKVRDEIIVAAQEMGRPARFDELIRSEDPILSLTARMFTEDYVLGVRRQILRNAHFFMPTDLAEQVMKAVPAEPTPAEVRTGSQIRGSVKFAKKERI